MNKKISFFTLLVYIIFSSMNANSVVLLPASPQTPLNLSPTGKLIITSLWEEIDPTVVKQYEDREEKQLTKGKKYIEEMKQINRDKIKQLHSKDKIHETTAQSKPLSLKELYLDNLSGLKQKKNLTYAQWLKKKNETLTRWKQKQLIFLKNLPAYKENLVNFDRLNEKKILIEKTSSLSTNPQLNYHLIPGSLDIPIRDQGKRPTCSAFAAMRAAEIILKSSEKNWNLSEQYFYWLSKPKCQNSPCSQRGSWVKAGLGQSQKSLIGDIPLESHCPYRQHSMTGNETQIPLNQTCKQKGLIKIKNFKEITSLDQVVEQLQKNIPIIAGFKLSPDFYTTKGIVKYVEKSIVNTSAIDAHANGHALLIIGYFPLPSELHATEGKVCFLVANSWGEGWGIGGHACLTEKWVSNQRVSNPFVALTALEI